MRRRPSVVENGEVISQETTAWLVRGDPAVRWQVERDLIGAPDQVWSSTREQVATAGWGQELLSHRGADGLWSAALYSPKWTSTFYTLQTLGLLGLPSDNAPARASAGLLLDRGVRADGAVSLWASGAPDTCVSGMLLRTAAGFDLASDERCASVAGRLLEEQLPDGGWNCRRARGATHSSFHTTISVLEGLHAWHAQAGRPPDAVPALQAGRAFLLAHQLFRSHRDGSVVNAAMTSFSFPRYWYFDLLRGLEHFAEAGAGHDVRCEPAIEVVLRKRGRDGRWRLGRAHAGRTWLTMEEGGRPSRWVTLAAERVLAWWERA